MTFDEAFAGVPGHGWMNYNEARELWDAANLAPRPRVLEIGVYYGRSAFIIGAALADNPKARLTLCDPFNDGHHFVEGDRNISKAMVSIKGALERSGIGERAHLFVGTELDLFESGRIGMDGFDMIHFDGDHSYIATLEALRRWHERANKGCLFLCHDWALSGGGVAVKLAIEQATSDGILRLMRVTERMAVCEVLK